MDRFPSLETRHDSPEYLLKQAQEHALPSDVAKTLIATIEQLKSEPHDTTAEIENLQQALEQSMITVQTLPEFRTLLEQTGHNSLLLEEVLDKGELHGTLAEKIGAHHEGYTLLVMKDGDDFRYKADALYSHPSVVMPTQNLTPEVPHIETLPQPVEERMKRDTAAIEQLRKELGK